MANSDQFVEWDSSKTLYAFSNLESDGVKHYILKLKSHPKWSYVKLNDEGYVKKLPKKNLFLTMQLSVFTGGRKVLNM